MRNRPFTRNAAFILAFVLAVSMLAGYFAPSTDALPANEIEIYYYDSPSHTNQVGERFISCTGHGNYFWGTVTSYKVVYSTPCW